jgi:hypothetical protein
MAPRMRAPPKKGAMVVPKELNGLREIEAAGCGGLRAEVGDVWVG